MFLLIDAKFDPSGTLMIYIVNIKLVMSIARGLQLKLIYNTAKSARQTTPNLIKNPILARRGLVTQPNKSYAYDLPEDLPNRHLYWNNTIQNRIRRK